MLHEIEFDDGRGRFTDVIRARTPLGWREQLKDIARQRGMSFGQLVRDALAAHVASLQGERADHPEGRPQAA